MVLKRLIINGDNYYLSPLAHHLKLYTMKKQNFNKTNYPSYRGKEKKNRHHLLNKVNGGESSKQNLLWIKIERHHAWHYLFDNLNLDEVIALLQRVKRAKENQTN